MKIKLFSAIIAGSILFSGASHAAIIGVFGDSTSQAIGIANDLGHTAQVISDFDDLAAFDVVWGLNGSNSGHLSDLVSNQSQFDTYVSGGGVFMYHDRAVTDANNVLAGADDFTFVRGTATDIDVIGTNDVAGVDIDNTTLDGGNSSNHGFVELASINLPFTGIFSTGNANEIIDFTYEFGLGDVYYSAIPLDYYLGGGTTTVAEFNSVYAPNVLAFSVGLAEAEAVSAPVTLSIFALGLAGLFAARRKN